MVCTLGYERQNSSDPSNLKSYIGQVELIIRRIKYRLLKKGTKNTRGALGEVEGSNLLYGVFK